MRMVDWLLTIEIHGVEHDGMPLASKEMVVLSVAWIFKQEMSFLAGMACCQKSYVQYVSHRRR